jgi:hypothetical protein
MTPSERLQLAGEAAELLEEMGFVAVARLRDGLVTLEGWDRTASHGRRWRTEVDEDLAGATPAELARDFVAAVRASDPGHEDS